MFVSIKVIRTIMQDAQMNELLELILNNIDPSNYTNSQKLSIICDAIVGAHNNLATIKRLIETLNVNVNGFHNNLTLLGFMCEREGAFRSKERPKPDIIDYMLSLPNIDMYAGQRSLKDPFVTYLLNQQNPDDTSIIDVFLKHGYDVNHKNKLGETPTISVVKYNLWYLSTDSRISALKKLISLGADITITDDAGKDCLDHVQELIKQERKFGNAESAKQLEELIQHQSHDGL